MPIPDFQSLTLPLLRFTADQKEHTRKDAAPVLAKEFNLTPEEQAQMLPSGKQEVFLNRLHWARTHLVKAGLLEATRHGWFRITERGLQVLKSPPPKVTVTFLRQFPEFAEFRDSSTDHGDDEKDDKTAELTPEETIETAFVNVVTPLRTSC